jgi:hypothetical protein
MCDPVGDLLMTEFKRQLIQKKNTYKKGYLWLQAATVTKQSTLFSKFYLTNILIQMLIIISHCDHLRFDPKHRRGGGNCKLRV